MTRTEFVKFYADNSGLESPYAGIGLLDEGGKTLCALPCDCGDSYCQGWAMLSANAILHHLQFNAPSSTRIAPLYAPSDSGAARRATLMSDAIPVRIARSEHWPMRGPASPVSRRMTHSIFCGATRARRSQRVGGLTRGWHIR